MSDLGKRLRRLEPTSPGGACAECGQAPGEPFVPDEVTWLDEEDAEPVLPEWCSTCGRQTTFVVGWRDLEPDEAGEGAS